jgi:poly(rC)-binding protein 2/3/4
MPEVESNRKRSRSPSDSEQQKQHKRPNTGASSSDASPVADSSVPAAVADVAMSDASRIVDTAASTPIKNEDDESGEKTDSTTSAVKAEGATTSAEPSASTSPVAPPSASIHMRCLIVTQDASIIIGKGGSHVNEIREKSGAKVMVSESIPGNPERILNVSGPLDAVSKVSLRLRDRGSIIDHGSGFWSHRSTHQR